MFTVATPHVVIYFINIKHIETSHNYTLPSSHSVKPLSHAAGQEAQSRAQALLSSRQGKSSLACTQLGPICRQLADTTQSKRKEWTEEEEVVWRELVERTIRKHLLQAVREDGRLNHRKNSIKSHMNALVSLTTVDV